MSTILKALRQLEDDEKRRAEAMQVHAEVVATGTEGNASGRRVWLWGSLAAAGAVALVFASWVFLLPPPVPAPGPSVLPIARPPSPPVAAAPVPSLAVATRKKEAPARRRALNETGAEPPALEGAPPPRSARDRSSATARRRIPEASVLPGKRSAPPLPIPEQPAAKEREVAASSNLASRSASPSTPRVEPASVVAAARPESLASQNSVAQGPASPRLDRGQHPGVAVVDLAVSDVRGRGDSPPAATPSTPKTELVSAARPARAIPVPPAPSRVPERLADLEAWAVLRTTWHPHSEKRMAVLRPPDGGEMIELREGDFWQGFRIHEIKLSGLVFERAGIRIVRQVGEIP